MNGKRLSATGAMLGALVAGAALSAPMTANAAPAPRSAASVHPNISLTPWDGPYPDYPTCNNRETYLYQYDHGIAGCSDLVNYGGYANGWWVMHWSS